MAAAAEITRYRYTPFSSAHSIRLLKLEPSVSQSKPIECQLIETRFDVSHTSKAARYEALSYTWGERHGTIPISCSGQQLLVTPNCESALRHLRHKLTPRVLWVDAICIDQQSVQEKNIQVPLMGKIFSLATQVVIWLGAGLPGDEDVLLRARVGGRLYYTRGYSPKEVLPGQFSRNLASKVLTPQEITNVRRICSNVCFTRMWTLQELLLATSAVFQIGRSECTASQLYSYFIVAEALAESGFSEAPVFRMRSRLLERLQPGAGRDKALLGRVHTLGRTAESDETEFLAMALRLAALSNAADNRDKIYGMYGLLQRVAKGAELPKVDYTRTVPEVYEEATRSLIQVTKSLWPLELITHHQPGDSDLPSWVPDLRDPMAVDIDWQPRIWRHVHNDTELNLPETSKLKRKLEEMDKERRSVLSPRREELTFSGEERPGMLPVKAKYLAEIVEVYARMPAAGRGTPEGRLIRTACLTEWTAVAAKLEPEVVDNRSITFDYFEALQGLTPRLNGIRELHAPPSTDRRTPPSGDSITTDKVGDHGPEDTYDGAVLFLTSCGLLGLCKGDVQPKDKIWQLAGGRYPYVLRRELQPSTSTWSSWAFSSEEKFYSLVGIADVYGLDSNKREMLWAPTYDERYYHDITLI